MAGVTAVITLACIRAARHCLDMRSYAPQVPHAPEKDRRCANRGLMPEDTTTLVLVHSPHRCFWWRRRFRLIPPPSGVANLISPRMLLLLSGRLLVVLTFASALLLLSRVSLLLALLLLSGTTKIPLPNRLHASSPQ